MIPTDFCGDMSNGLKDIAIYDKFKNGHMVNWLDDMAKIYITIYFLILVDTI